MGIEYDLNIAGPLDPESLLQLVERGLDLEPERDVIGGPDVVGRAAPGFYLTAMPVSSQFAEVDAEWSGIAPRVSVTFRMDKEWDPRDALLRMMRAVGAVLAAVPDDASFVYNGDQLWLRRQAGHLVARADRVDADALAALGLPCELGELPDA
ncbi:MAG: hypothetical protein H6708_29600 [Kofleriaceae bacterium]|nr:hypothetical protein [Myxococcales bacterium]MCB9564560.1 hypothetical protein [Kofleriaceae bacterium]